MNRNQERQQLDLPGDPLIGMVASDRYRLESCIGSGGWSLVYKATDTLLNRDVAIKILHLPLAHDSEKVERFQREARTSAQLQHANVASVYDVGALPSGQPFIVIQFLKGMSLSDMLAQREKIPPKEAVEIFAQVCDALQAAHDRHILHRDLKPSNIFIQDDQTVKLVDFGLAKFLAEEDQSESLTSTGNTVGTPGYMSPEQCQGLTLDERSDIYALGCTLYETLTGKQAFSGSTLECMQKHLNETAPPFKAVAPDAVIPDGLECVVFKALEKEPRKRFQSVAEFRDQMLSGFQSAKWYRIRLQLRRLLQDKRFHVASTIASIMAGLIIAGLVLQTHIVRAGSSHFPHDADPALIEASRMAGHGDPAGAIKVLETAKVRIAREHGANSPQMLMCCLNLASMYKANGRFEEAAAEFEHANQIDKMTGHRSRGSLFMLSELVESYDASDQTAKAKATLAELLALAKTLKQSDGFIKGTEKRFHRLL